MKGILLLIMAGFLSAFLFHAQANEPSTTLFESGQVRPLALSPDGSTLFALNTPNHRVEIFRTTETGLQHCGAVPVGLEPVAVAAWSETEVWVVNHVSDSVSIVQVQATACEPPMGHVVRTLWVGDEPRDIVFGGPQRDRAFITAAHRGQNAPFDPALTTPGIGRADVWVFDAKALGTSLGGEPLTIISLFTDTPRALAVSPDGERVYAAGFHTGNQTTTVFEDVVSSHGGLPEPQRNIDGDRQAPTGLIVKFNGEHWVDELGRTWDPQVRFSLPDYDVFAIDATTNPPQPVAGPEGRVAHVGTVLFNMIVNPANGHVYVSNTEARNEIRFEGPGTMASSVRGQLHQSRITVIQGGGATPRHINKHIDYRSCCAPIPNDENARSLAFPMEMAITPDGQTLYVTAFGSSKIGVFDTTALENDTFVPDTAHQIALTGGGPSGLVLDDTRNRLYVLTRFDNAISIIDTAQQLEVAQVRMFNPEPESVVQGRRFLYDAAYTSSHGDSACASCHVFGDLDSLAWDLGNPDASQIDNPGPFALSPEAAGVALSPHFQALKGPMTTQSLRGLANHGPMHWRGDRLGGNDAPSAQPDSGTFDEVAAFKKFNVAFEGLLGRYAPLTDAELQQFTDFVLQLLYPPNPIRKLDNSLTSDQQVGRDFYFNDSVSDTFFNCNGCHVLDPSGNTDFDVARPGFFGTDGRYAFQHVPQMFKVPHLRNQYQKVGMFGMPQTTLIRPESSAPENAFMGEQIRGFGFLHDGSVDTIFRFLDANLFSIRGPFGSDPGNLGGFQPTPQGRQKRRQVEQFLFVFDSNLAPIVGQQVTLVPSNAEAAGLRIDLLRSRAALGECDLVAKQSGRGYLYRDDMGLFTPDRSDIAPVSDAALRQLVIDTGAAITYTCAPPGDGVRFGIDRDGDGVLDGDERLAGGRKVDAASESGR